MINAIKQKSQIEEYVEENNRSLKNIYLFSSILAGASVLGALGSLYFKVSEPDSILPELCAGLGGFSFVSFLYGLDSAEKIKGNSKQLNLHRKINENYRIN